MSCASDAGARGLVGSGVTHSLRKAADRRAALTGELEARRAQLGSLGLRLPCLVATFAAGAGPKGLRCSGAPPSLRSTADGCAQLVELQAQRAQLGGLPGFSCLSRRCMRACRRPEGSGNGHAAARQGRVAASAAAAAAATECGAAACVRRVGSAAAADALPPFAATDEEEEVTRMPQRKRGHPRRATAAAAAVSTALGQRPAAFAARCSTQYGLAPSAVADAAATAVAAYRNRKK